MARLAYCPRSDVLVRLFAAQSAVTLGAQVYSPAAPADAQRDALLDDLIAQCSRRFDEECGRAAEDFAPKYEARLYSGTGSQLFEVDEFATLSKIEVNTSPSQPGNPTWTDLTAELAAGNIQARPLRFWPKSSLFRMATFYQDPYLAGNVRLTAVWGDVQPDLGATPPVAPWQGLTLQSQITALQPLDPSGAPAGWWITPEDVRQAVAEWVVYSYHAERAGYGDTAGSEAQGGVLYTKGIPPRVQQVILTKTRSRVHVAMITPDGVDIAEENQRYGTPGALSRWAGWQASH
ncbi:MAG TPA: hypothetical protein VKQ71_01590 [Acidimicrobiales bacterium]|nr:hypothetical protein [Acidimicrobiales bacterium]